MAIIKGTINNDVLLSGKEFDGLDDVILGLAGNDQIDAGLGAGGNTLGGGGGNDLLYASTGDLVLGDMGNDELDASDEGGNNSLYGGEGQDTIYAGENDKVFGGSGDDNIFAGTGNNILYGGTGRDRFWLANAEVPTSVNTVADFNAQADQMVIKLEGVNALTNLSFEQTGGDTLIKLAATGESLAIVKNTASTVFNSNNVIFDETAPLNTSLPINNPREQDRKTVNGVENLGLVTFSTDTFFKETQVGGLSGIVYDKAQNSYYAISDDRSSINPARFYTLKINLSDGRLDSGDVSFTQVTTLLDSQGNPFPLNSLDTEGIALTENGSVYIASEGEARPDIPRLTNPFVNQFSLSGQQLSELPVAEKYFPTQTVTTGIRNNLAFESLTMTPDGRYLYTATENALVQDGSAATLTDTSLSRIVKYDLTTGQVVAEYVYEVEKVGNNPIPDGSFATNGLVELLAIDNNGTLLALERGFSTGVGNTVKLYEIQTQNATNISSLDDIFSEAENMVVGVDFFVSKKLLVDFQADLGIIPDNLEGLALGPVLADGRQSLIVVSDNNFSTSQTTQFIALALEFNEVPTNNPPTAVILSNTVTQLAENSDTTGGIKVADISITDDGQGTNILFLSGADATSFEIRGNELFFIGDSPDFETQNQYDVTVNVDDITVGETPDASTDFTLNITDVNEVPTNNPPTAVILSNTVTQLAENSDTTGGIKVADISITDDGQGTNILFLSGADATSFEIRGNQLFFIGNSPDFETKTKYDVTVNVDDITVGETPDASTDFTLNITNLPDENISDRVTQFNNKGDNLGSLVYNLSDVSGNANTQADDAALNQTDALFHNLVGLYQVENADGGIFDTLDLNGNGLTNDLLNPGDSGYARTAITNAVNNFVLQIGANGNPTDNTSGSEFGDVLLQGGKRYSPFVIANGGNLIPTGGTLQDGINNFLDQNPNNIAADLSNFMNHAVAYFSFGMANPDGTEHLQNRGNNVFGFEDLPGNLGISDFDFNDAVFKFTFIG